MASSSIQKRKRSSHRRQGCTRDSLFAVIGPGDAVVSPICYPIHQLRLMREGTPASSRCRTRPASSTLLRLYRGRRNAGMILISFPHNLPRSASTSIFSRRYPLARHTGPWCSRFRYADLGFDGYRPPSISRSRRREGRRGRDFFAVKSYNMAGLARRLLLGNRG